MMALPPRDGVPAQVRGPSSPPGPLSLSHQKPLSTGTWFSLLPSLTMCFTICLCIRPDLDGYRAPNTKPVTICHVVCVYLHGHAPCMPCMLGCPPSRCACAPRGEGLIASISHSHPFSAVSLCHRHLWGCSRISAEAKWTSSCLGVMPATVAKFSGKGSGTLSSQ